MTSAGKTQISLRLPVEVVEMYDRIAEALDRDRTWVIHRALSKYLKEEGREILDDAQGLEELDRGDRVELDDVLQKARRIVANAEQRHRDAS